MVIMLSGYVGVMLSVAMAQCNVGKHSQVLSMFSITLSILSPFIGRILPLEKFLYYSDQLINVYNCIKLPLIYQFGGIVIMQIPYVISAVFNCFNHDSSFYL